MPQPPLLREEGNAPYTEPETYALRQIHAQGRPRDLYKRRRVIPAPGERQVALFCLRPPLRHFRWPGRHLPGPLQSRWTAAGSTRICRRAPTRPGREEAVLPCAAWIAGDELRYARLRLPLRVLPELGHIAGGTRSQCDCSAPSAHT